MNPYADLTAAGPLFQMQQAIAARLQLAFPPPRFHHDILPAAPTPSMWSDLARRTPLIALGFVGVRPALPNEARGFQARAEWRVVPVIRNAAGARARLLGDLQGPGQLGLLQVAIAALHGMTIDGVGAVEVTDAANLYAEGYADEAAALSGVTLGVTFALATAGGPDAPRLLRLVTGWTFGAATAAESNIDIPEAS